MMLGSVWLSAYEGDTTIGSVYVVFYKPSNSTVSQFFHLQLKRNEGFGVVGDTSDGKVNVSSLGELWIGVSKCLNTSSGWGRGYIYLDGQFSGRKWWVCHSVLGPGIPTIFLLCNRLAKLDGSCYWHPRRHVVAFPAPGFIKCGVAPYHGVPVFVSLNAAWSHSGASIPLAYPDAGIQG